MAITAEQLDKVMPSAAELLSDEPEMESSLHYTQLALLYDTLDWFWRDRTDYFIGANLTIYFSREQLKTRDFRGPDLFVARNVDKHPRNSWVVWEEGGKYPDLIIELLSDSTEEIDRTIKKELYEQRFRTQEYFYFSPQTEELKGFDLRSGRYEEIIPDQRGLRWSNVLQLFFGIHQHQLRYFLPNGELLFTIQEAIQFESQQAQKQLIRAQEEARRAETEAKRAAQEFQRAEEESQRAELMAQQAEQEAQRAEIEARRAEQETQRADKLAARLREAGIDPDAP